MTYTGPYINKLKKSDPIWERFFNEHEKIYAKKRKHNYRVDDKVFQLRLAIADLVDAGAKQITPGKLKMLQKKVNILTDSFIEFQLIDHEEFSKHWELWSSLTNPQKTE